MSTWTEEARCSMLSKDDTERGSLGSEWHASAYLSQHVAAALTNMTRRAALTQQHMKG
jgi:hypothetical protein